MKTSMLSKNSLGIPAITSVELYNFSCLMGKMI